MRRKRILVAGDVGRAVLLGSIPIAYVFDALTLGQLYVVGFLVGICTVFFDVAYQSYLPSLVERNQIIEGNSKLEITRSAAQIGGPGFAGILIQVFTAPYAVLIDAVSFVASGLFIFRIRAAEETRSGSKGRTARSRACGPSSRRASTSCSRNPNLRAQAGCTSTSNFFSSVGFSIILVYAVRELDLSAGLIGFIFSLGALGGLLAAVSATRISSRFGIGPTTIVMAAFFGPTMLLYAVAPAGNAAVPLLVTAQLIFGFTVVVYNIVQVSYRQAICPPRMQGRMNSVMRFIVWGTIPLGTLTGGALASWIGLRETIVIGAIGGGLAVLWIVFSPQRHLRDMPEPVDDEAATETGLEESVPSLSA